MEKTGGNLHRRGCAEELVGLLDAVGKLANNLEDRTPIWSRLVAELWSQHGRSYSERD